MATTPVLAAPPSSTSATATPIKHVVVIFQENVSFDHYFATYPYASNPDGEPAFHAFKGTPAVNGLTPELIAFNPNPMKPQRLDRSQAATCDMDHGYTDEQTAEHGGLMDGFALLGCDNNGTVMDYYDGNTVTALWNYAQYFAMSDNSFGTTFGPSTPGALNLVAGQTHGVTPTAPTNRVIDSTLISDLDPVRDDCSKGTKIDVTDANFKNVGDLLNERNVTWGWFEGGFKPTSYSSGVAVCGTSHTGVAGSSIDYIPHHEPFQYFASTANPHHLPPTSVAMIGHSDQANHQYDLSDFWAAADAGNLPAVSYLKAPAYQDGHAGYSDPLDEQNFIVETINHLQRLPQWNSTAVIISYDDSDGWYDHVMGPVVQQSNTAADTLLGPGLCGTAGQGEYQGRCGYGPRLPLMVISPWAKRNFVDHTTTDQSSILRFIEDNWGLGRLGNQSFDAKAGTLLNMFDFRGERRTERLVLDPESGEVVSAR
ncbi:MAG: alkaline phosphatase family protein [Terriglobia bacterium]|nr:alkaline phosphatase family protein [Terriglobia bacterium]